MGGAVLFLTCRTISVLKKKKDIFYKNGNTCHLYGTIQFIKLVHKLFSVILKTMLGSRKGRNANFIIEETNGGID